MATDERTARHGAARAEQRPSSVLELVGSDQAMSTVLSFLVPTLPALPLNHHASDKGQFSGGRLREALALGRLVPGVCVAKPTKVGPSGAALMATDACLGGLLLARGSSWPHVFEALKLNTGLRKLDLQWGELNDGDVVLLCGALAVNVSLVDVDFSLSSFDRTGARAMADILSTTTSLQTLKFGDCGLQPDDVAGLAGALAKNASLRELQLTVNNVGEAGARALAAALETNTTLHVLRMNYANLGDAEGIAIGAALATNTGLFQLDLSDNKLGEGSGRAMAAALATNTTLRALDLSRNRDIGGSGAVALFGGLRSNHTLLELRLARTELDHTSGVALADTVSENSTLRVLDLSDNKLLGREWDGSGSCSWAQVLAALKDNSGLHTLSLQNCGLTADDGRALAEALEQRPGGLLRKVELGGNPGIGDTSCGAIIAACLKPGSSVACLEGVLLRKLLGREAMRSLAQGLRQDNKLEVLDLFGINGFFDGESSWTGLFVALAVNARVHTLWLRGCDLTAGDGQALASALEQRPVRLLRNLTVDDNEGLGDDACSAIIVACLKPGSALRELNIKLSGAGLAVTLSLARCLRANHTLDVLLLEGIHAEGNWSELFGALAVNSGLRTLSIRECGLQQRDIEALAAALRTNHVMQRLDVIGGGLGNECAQIMAGGLATNTTLRSLHLDNRWSTTVDAAAIAFCTLLQTNSTLRELKCACYPSAGSYAAVKALVQAGRAKGCYIALNDGTFDA